VVRAVEVHPLSSLFSSPLRSCPLLSSMLHAPCSGGRSPFPSLPHALALMWKIELRRAAGCSPLASGAAVPGPDPFELDGAV
jgi:hypothetical protein